MSATRVKRLTVVGC